VSKFDTKVLLPFPYELKEETWARLKFTVTGSYKYSSNKRDVSLKIISDLIDLII
jgi:methyl coenzyme M reductase subunit D